MRVPGRILDLREHEPAFLHRTELSEEEAEVLWRNHHKQINVEYPSPRSSGDWKLSSLGWVGHLPVTRELSLRLTPKVKLDNLFHMLEVAYSLPSLEFPGLIDCGSLEEIFERLAHILARRVLARGRRGFYREYVPQEDRLPYIRGRLDLNRALRAPWEVSLDCHYQEHTADVEDNQILAWTLSRIARSAACSRSEVASTVGKAFRSLQGIATPMPLSPSACSGRLYTRLNDDYRPLHALCRFFLENTGPTHEPGDRQALPFLVNMNNLFEMFVAEWLTAHLPPGLKLRPQENVPLGSGMWFKIDGVLYERSTGQPLLVLDTKYKDEPSPTTADIAQVVAYAEAKGCRDAVLVYPVDLRTSFDIRVGTIRVRTLAFRLDGDLEANGLHFLGRLLTAPHR
ncbi:MAG TPA: restriction endonuclease [Thermoanaerobaculia bacterium]|nr:restriction endonuclease [Thermoanaerobaculia bacterium]